MTLGVVSVRVANATNFVRWSGEHIYTKEWLNSAGDVRMDAESLRAGGPKAYLPATPSPSPEGPRLVDAVGGTPLIRIGERSLGLPPDVQLWGKAEFLNPGGSVKDRTALSIVQDALTRGDLSGGRTLLDASSGNTGIAYAMLGAALGFPVEIVIPENASAERIARLRAHGAKITFSSRLEGTDGAQAIAREKARSGPERYYYPDQYNNPSNPWAHYRTTGPEIFRQTGGKITHFVAGVGTGGTISGTGKYLKERTAVTVIGVVPDQPMHGIEGLKHLPTSVRPGTLDASVVDRWVEVSTEDALAMVRTLARSEGLFVGTSSGAAVEAARQIAAELDHARIVCVLPDGGERYLKGSSWEDSP